MRGYPPMANMVGPWIAPDSWKMSNQSLFVEQAEQQRRRRWTQQMMNGQQLQPICQVRGSERTNTERLESCMKNVDLQRSVGQDVGGGGGGDKGEAKGKRDARCCDSAHVRAYDEDDGVFIVSGATGEKGGDNDSIRVGGNNEQMRARKQKLERRMYRAFKLLIA